MGDTSGYLKKLLVILVQGQRPETNQVNENDAENDAKSLYEAGEKKWGTDESKFIEILSTKRFIFVIIFCFSNSYFISNAHLKAVCEAYGKFSKKDIEAAIKSETSGSLCRGLLAISKYIIKFISHINSNYL